MNTEANLLHFFAMQKRFGFHEYGVNKALVFRNKQETRKVLDMRTNIRVCQVLGVIRLDFKRRKLVIHVRQSKEFF